MRRLVVPFVLLLAAGPVQAQAPVRVSSAGAMAVHEEPRELPVVSAGLVTHEKDIMVAALPQDWSGLVKLVRPQKPMLAAAHESTVPQAISIRVNGSGQPRKVARLLKS